MEEKKRRPRLKTSVDSLEERNNIIPPREEQQEQAFTPFRATRPINQDSEGSDFRNESRDESAYRPRSESFNRPVGGDFNRPVGGDFNRPAGREPFRGNRDATGEHGGGYNRPQYDDNRFNRHDDFHDPNERNFNNERTFNQDRNNYSNFDTGRPNFRTGGYQQRPYQNRNNNDRPYQQRNDRPYNNNGGYNNDRPYTPRDNDRPYQPRDNNRPYTPRDNDRPYQPRDNNRPYTPRDNDRPYQPRDNDRPYQPRDNNRNYDNGGGFNQGGGYQNRQGGGGGGYQNRNNDFQGNRPYRNDDNRQGGGGGFNRFDNRNDNRYNNNSGGGNRNFRPQGGGGGNFNSRPRPMMKPKVEDLAPQIGPKPELPTGEGMPLNKYIAHCGICSRRKAVEYIHQGLVTVNGTLIKEPYYRINDGDAVVCDGKALAIQERLVYVLFNKPANVITTSDDEMGRTTVMDYINAHFPERLYPIGRLDRDTTGLIVITNDGDLAQKLGHPSGKLYKQYKIVTTRPVSAHDIETLEKGIELEDGLVELNWVRYAVDRPKNEVELELVVGKNRVVRRLFEHLGYEVKRLDRYYYGGLTKKALKRGAFRELTQREIIMLKHFS